MWRLLLIGLLAVWLDEASGQFGLGDGGLGGDGGGGGGFGGAFGDGDGGFGGLGEAVEAVASTFSGGLRALSLEDLDPENPAEKVLLDAVWSLVDAATGGDSSPLSFFPGVSLRLRKSFTDRNGHSHQRLEQLFGSVKVLNCDVLVHNFPESTVDIFPNRDRKSPTVREGSKQIPAQRTLSGLFLAGIAFPGNSIPGLSLIQDRVEEIRDWLKENIKQSLGSDLLAGGWDWVEGQEDYAFVVSWGDAENVRLPSLSFELRALGWLPNKGGASRPYRLIEASPEQLFGASPSILSSYDSLAKQSPVSMSAVGGNEKAGRRAYDGADMPQLKLIPQNGRCYFASDFFELFRMSGDKATDDVVHSVPCGEAVPSEEPINGAYDAVSEAFFNVGAIAKMFEEWYEERPQLESAWLPLRVNVLGAAEDNAAWTGTDIMLYKGKDLFHPLTAVGVVTHEIGHAISEANSGLEYTGESGGVNEAFSDIASKAAEYYVYGAERSHWSVARDIIKAGEGARFMDDPAKDGKSIASLGDYSEGSTSVHFSSGILNKAFTEMVKDGSSLSIPDAFDAVLVAQMHHWRRSTGFAKAAEGIVRAMCELKQGKYIPRGYDWVRMSHVTKAFRPVGIRCKRKKRRSCRYSCKPR